MGRRKEEEETTREEICYMYVEREYWWWNDDVQKAVKGKRDSFKKCQSSRTTEDLADYRENKTDAKKAMTTAKDAGYEELYTKLDSREGQNMIYKLAKTRYRRKLDQEDMKEGRKERIYLTKRETTIQYENAMVRRLSLRLDIAASATATEIIIIII